MEKKGKNIVKDICFNGLFAAVYVAFVLIFGDLSFGFANGIISFRVAELLIALCCFNKRFIPGAIIGCLVANIFGGQMIDVIVGTLQTTLTVIIFAYVKPKQLAILLGTLLCGVIIGFELILLQLSIIGYWIILTIFISEFIIVEIGYFIFKKFYFSLNIK